MGGSTWEWNQLRKGTRGQYRMVERRWVIEYLARKCSDAIDKFVHKRLGRVPEDLAARYPGIPTSALKVYLPYVDAVCVFEDRIELIEFKVHDPTKGISQLVMYKNLALEDDELRRYLPRPIVPKLVYWRHDPALEALCKQFGIVFEVDLPTWLIPILREYGYKVL